MVLGFVYALIIYVLGTYSVYRIFNDLMNTLSPWIGVFGSVIYIVLITVFLVISMRE